MNQSKIFFICALSSLLSLGAVQASAEVIDNFNSYSSVGPLPDSYVQGQNTAWSTSGNARTDGIYSIAGGQSGRGANFSMAWTPTFTAARVKYDFASPQAYSLGVVFTMDLKTSAAIAGTNVYGVILDSTGTAWSTVGQAVLNTASYATYSFTFNTGTTTRTDGAASLVSALSDTRSFTMQLTNTTGTGSQQISFDNLTVTNVSAVPEPSTVAVLMGAAAGLLCVGSKWRKKRLSKQS